MSRQVIYPGTFDPLTNGHLDIITRATRLFDSVTVGIAASSQKNPLFSLDERIDLTRQATAHLPTVTVKSFNGLLVDFAKQEGISILIRGLRDATDFDYELRLVRMNSHLFDKLESIYLTPDEKYAFISSSLIKEVVRFGGDVRAFLPPVVFTALSRRTR